MIDTRPPAALRPARMRSFTWTTAFPRIAYRGYTSPTRHSLDFLWVWDGASVWRFVVQRYVAGVARGVFVALAARQRRRRRVERGLRVGGGHARTSTLPLSVQPSSTGSRDQREHPPRSAP